MATQDQGTTNDTGTQDAADLSDAELEALQRKEDGEDVDADDTLQDDAKETQAAAPAAPAPSPEPTPAPTPAPAAAQDAGAGKPEGVASKDGSRVLPYAALQAERRAARAASARADRAEKELEATRQQIEDLKAGKTTVGELTEEDVQSIEADFPEDGKKMRLAFERLQAAKAAVAANPPAKPEKDDEDDPALKTQELIDTIPTLLQWQHEESREKFNRVCDVDALYAKSPKWKDKPVIERFEAATKFVADEYGVEYEGPAKPKASSNAPAPAPTSATAAAPTAAAPSEPARKNPETLSDFKHGATPEHGTADWSRMSPQVGVNRMLEMSDEEIDAHLAKHG